MKTIGDKILFFRERNGIKQKVLAKSIGITETSLSRYENDLREPKAGTVAMLAKSLNTTADFLLGLTTDFSPKIKDDHWDNLTAEESLYMNKYRSLTPENKLRLNERIEALLDGQD